VLSGEIESPDYIYIDQVANGKWAVYGVDIIDINYEYQVEITDLPAMFIVFCVWTVIKLIP